MRGFLVGLVLLTALAASVLALRPGGFRRQLRLVARRFRIVLALGGAYVFGSLVIRLLFTSGPVNEWGPVALALILAVVFVFVGGDPAP
ncbi:MAG TPA: hypothetical protein VG364_07520 [Candidatus Dormibacteraeota bacterium]|nr:hypothetical protein [Candidatus Dormibacteraeota bacterium]